MVRRTAREEGHATLTADAGRLRVLHCEPEAYSAEAFAELRALATVDAVSKPRDLGPRLRDGEYHAVFVGIGVAVTREIFRTADSLRWVVTPTTGTSHIDMDAAKEHGVRVLSLSGRTEFLSQIRATAEHTFALLLALRRRLIESVDLVRSGGWERRALIGDDLGAQTMGIVGYGRLGRMVADIAAAFQMHVLVHDVDREATRFLPPHVRSVDLNSVLGNSDVISLHLTLDDTTRGLIGESAFALVKPGAVLVNTSRGEIVSERALLVALENKQLAGAALDVISGDSSWPEASPPGHPLISYARNNPNLLITPHIGGYSRQAVQSTRDFIVRLFIEAVGADKITSKKRNECPI